MQIASLESERDALNRRIRGLQKELEEIMSRLDGNSTVQQEAIAAALASKMAYIEELKATDIQIINEVSEYDRIAAIQFISLCLLSAAEIRS